MNNKPRWLKRIAWLIVIWALSVLVLYMVAYALKLLMNAVGLSIN